MKLQQVLFLVVVLTVVMTDKIPKFKLDNGKEVKYGCLPKDKKCAMIISDEVFIISRLKVTLNRGIEEWQIKMKG